MRRRETMGEWLASSHPDPARVWTEWADSGIAVIPVGRGFGAVRLPEAIVHAALESADPDRVGSVLDDRLDGPVIHDGRGRNYYPLTATGAQLDWGTTTPGVEALPPGTHLGVPAPDLDRYSPQTPVYWAAPGHGPRHCPSAAVALLVRVGTARLAEATPW
ncbi:hypothetical protein ACFWUQ_16120 [Streptomyces sp. NPDC058662]|uniref:hypothetical protein n=1 Tax=Streptomyces sp. NPDC058662 TaxID=3346583 RepID=UPI00364A4EAE